MSDALHIRQYRAEDHDAVWNLHLEALNAQGANLGHGEWDNDFRDIESVYIKSGGEFLVGELDGKIIAMGGLRKMSDKRAELKRMRVKPEYQRRGFGQIVLEKLEQRAKELGFAELQLDSMIILTVAHAFYEKNGYREFRRGVLGGHEAIYFEKILSQQ